MNNIPDCNLLFCGDGHGAVSVLEGLVDYGFLPDVSSNDEQVKSIMSKNKLKPVDNLSHWIKSPTDIVLSASYKPLILKSDLERCPILNVHYALLPRYRGLHSTVWSILNGEKHVGWSFHVMDELLDAGPILYQEKIEIGTKTSWELMLEMDQRAKKMTPPMLEKYIRGDLAAKPQDDDLSLFVAKRNLEDCRIKWSEWDCTYFERVLKALVKPYPLPFFDYKDNRYFLKSAEVVHRYYHEIPGHVVYKDRESVWIKLKDGLLRVYSFELNGSVVKATDIFKLTGARL